VSWCSTQPGYSHRRERAGRWSGAAKRGHYDRIFPVTTFSSFVVNTRTHGVVREGRLRRSECNRKKTRAAEEEFPQPEYPCVTMSTGYRKRNNDRGGLMG